MLINRKLICWLIVVAAIVNFLGIFQPLIRNDDPVLYATIAKHIAVSGDWGGLYFAGQPWLDKPHFPFWISAIFFKLFGINSFAYNFAGFIFYLLGGLYTYKLAKLLYNDSVGLISLLIYLTSVHLMMSGTFDIRAEAYLLGEIIPACYYWLLYDKRFNWRYLILASLFTAFAMMTKGVFVVITIFSGLVFTWLYTKQIHKMISGKWLLGYVCSLIFILPELICLYQQFDMHPELLVFGQHNVSGISWYFWGSQFGRFFNSGPIVHNNGNIFFFVHTYLWAFLPWSMLFIISMWHIIKDFKSNDRVSKAKNIYLLGNFWLTFILFSLTKFQLDHYTNIIMPFAAIFCADYIERTFAIRKFAVAQKIVGSLILLIGIISPIYLFHFSVLSLYAIIPFIILIWMWRSSAYSYHEQVVLISTLSICSVFVFALIVNVFVCKTYDVGYNLANEINDKNVTEDIYDLNSNMLPFEFYTKSNVYKVQNDSELPKIGKYYVLVKENSFYNQDNIYLNKLNFSLEYKFCGNTIDKIIPYYNNKSELEKHLECFILVKHHET